MSTAVTSRRTEEKYTRLTIYRPKWITRGALSLCFVCHVCPLAPVSLCILCRHKLQYGIDVAWCRPIYYIMPKRKAYFDACAIRGYYTCPRFDGELKMDAAIEIGFFSWCVYVRLSLLMAVAHTRVFVLIVERRGRVVGYSDEMSRTDFNKLVAILMNVNNLTRPLFLRLAKLSMPSQLLPIFFSALSFVAFIFFLFLFRLHRSIQTTPFSLGAH